MNVGENVKIGRNMNVVDNISNKIPSEEGIGIKLTFALFNNF